MTDVEQQKRRATAARDGGWMEIAADLVSSAVFGLGLILVVSPLFFYWFIHGNPDRYLWIINGPPPFDQFGGGPYQLFVLRVFPILAGMAFVAIGLGLRRRMRR